MTTQQGHGGYHTDLRVIGDGTQGCQRKVGDRPAIGCSGSQLRSKTKANVEARRVRAPSTC